MKKSTKVLGSIALSAALAMGTAVPAFAEVNGATGQYASNAVVSDEMSTFTYGATNDTGSAATAVNISTYTSQISVAVPLSITLALDTQGGAGYAPTNYKITNNTPVAVIVEKAEIKDSTDYGFGTAAFATKGASKVNGNVGDIFATLTPAGQTALNLDTANLALGTAGKALNWKIGAASGEGYVWTDLNGVPHNCATPTALKDAMKAEIGQTSTINGLADDFQAIVSWINGNNAARGTIEEAGGTDLPIAITNQSSSQLTGAGDGLANAASIKYTISVDTSAA